MKKALPPVFLAFSLFIVYLSTMAPGLTWANDGADGGDLITAAATNGVAHPTGYPVYLLLARMFQALPVGSLAYRTSLLSAVAAVVAVVFVYGILVWLPASPAAGNWQAGMIAGYMFGLCPVLWSQAVITEVYTLHSAFAASIIFLCLVDAEKFAKIRVENLRGLLLGLALGNHLTSVFLIPPVIVTTARQGNWRAFLRSAGWLCLGLLVYLLLPVRALSNPPINWGDPVSPSRFTWLVSGEMYQSRLLALSSFAILERLETWVTFLWKQFELPGILLALIGLIFFFKPTRIYIITLSNAILFSLFSMVYATADSYLYLMPVFLSFALWAGLGIDGLLKIHGPYLRHFKHVNLILFSILFFGVTANRWQVVDASKDLRAEQFGRHIMESAPLNALIFAKSDRAVFALWYFHYGLKQRPDIAVFATDLLHYDWYAESVRLTFPSLNWPDGFLWTENISALNATRPNCYINTGDDEELRCDRPAAAP